ncbi:DegT/DnrJ/EryC1/StrS family aminotransferase [Prochlorococcus marinus]|uniref:DegT/DnrJ/EryC1/StrS family aminotransferase n=1 Tax=Prochlorococcus marinus TaxID=1219 RepID=UPI0022B2DFC5|nr:DegT/DnrJ/EryC1/StrS family aminotransferase [Prochlorococcus marinus]
MQVPPFSLDQQLSEIGEDIKSSVLNVLSSGNYIGGEEVKKFESSFAEKTGVKHVIGCNSGTDALILALRALNIGPGDEVITPSFSFFATAEAISNVGAKPVFVDTDPANYLVDLNLLQQAVTQSTKAVLPVHLFGRPVDMDQIMSFAKRNEIKVIEDCAQAAGSEWGGKPVGSIGDIGCFSFFPTKNLGAAGDGGAVTTNDENLATAIRQLAVHGMPRRYFHTQLGYNSRLDAIQAAVLNVKLEHLFKWVIKRTEIAKRYHQLLKDIPGIILPEFSQNHTHINSWNQFVVRVQSSILDKAIINQDVNKQPIINNINLPNSSSRDWLKQTLSEYGVNTIIYYPIPIHLQPVYQKLGNKINSLPNTEILCSEVLSLPIFPELSIEQQDYVVNAIKQSIQKASLI